MSHADLSHADLRGAKMPNADLIDAELKGANLSKTKLGGADLSAADLGGAEIVDTDLKDVLFHQADLQGAIFEPNSLPEIRGIAAAEHLEFVTYKSNLTPLCNFGNSFKRAAFGVRSESLLMR